MRPARGRTSPAMAASVVLFPAPEGPKRTVIPGGASSVTSSANAPACASTRTRSVRSADMLNRSSHVERLDLHVAALFRGRRGRRFARQEEAVLLHDDA